MIQKFKLVYVALFSIVLLSFIGCNKRSEEKFSEQENIHKVEDQPNFTKAIAVLHPTEGNKVKGIVTFTLEGDSIKVVADVEGLKPGKHGFHVHEFGDCSATDGTSAGGHFNPTNNPHAAPTADKRHEGDLGNIEANKDGKAHLEWTDQMLSFSGKNSIIGRAVIVHGGEDDLKSQPSGDAGPRVACGVIGIAKQ